LGLLQDALLSYCTLYNDCPGGRTNAVVRHVSFAQITCLTSDARSLRVITDTRRLFEQGLGPIMFVAKYFSRMLYL